MASFYSALIANGIFPLQELIKGHDTVAVRRAMEESQWWSSERLREQQIMRLRTFLADIGTHVPYYRDLFKEHGFVPQGVQSTADLVKLPFLTKPLIRANADQLMADNARGLARFNTGGSSGEPLIFYIGKQRVSHDVAAKWRATRWWDVDIGDKEIVVWGSPIELGAQDRVRLLRDRVMRTELLPAFEMSETKLDAFVARIRAVRPAMLFGYPSSISLIARHADRRGLQMDNLGIKVVFVTAERLHDHQREEIHRTFGCPVANGYGGRDAGFIAHQCPQGGMHLTAEDVIVEIIDSDGKLVPEGTAGEVVITHLCTGDYPFVRYRTGDVAVKSQRVCACGRGLPLLEEIQGRTTDFVIAHDGTIMHGLSLIYVLRDISAVTAFKIVQETVGRVRVLVVPSEHFGESEQERISLGLKQRLGSSVDVVIERVNTIPPERSGKHRYVVSHVAP